MLAESPLDFLSLGQSAAASLTKGDDNPMFNAMRVFRTEINRAHGIANQRSAAATPGCVGTRFLLSRAHPKADICDLLAAQNLYGLGPGVYPHGTSPWPAHPNTLSYEVTVLEDQVTAKDRGGKETPVEALKRLTPAQRIGVLGGGKTNIYAQGKLTTGMIRAPLTKVQARLAKTAARPPPPPPSAPTQAPSSLPSVTTQKRSANTVADVTARARASARGPWGDFPAVNILASLGDMRLHPRYEAAKNGDAAAAYEIVRQIEARATRPWAESVRAMLGGARPALVPVQGKPTEDRPHGNALPSALAQVLGSLLGLPVDAGIIKTSAFRRTDGKGWERLALPPVFAGQLAQPSRGALIVDDALTQGGTLASLRGWLEGQGAHVSAAVALTGKPISATLAIQPATLKAVRGRYAKIENWWIGTFGYGFDRLTESEAQYLLKHGANADAARNRIAQSRLQAHQ